MGVKFSDERESILFISFFNGKMKYNVPEGSPGAITRTNKSNKVVHERFIDEVQGHITSIKRKDSEQYSPSWVVVLTDIEDGSKMQLQFPRSGLYADRFFRRLPNIDFSKPVIIAAFRSYEKDQLLIKQNGTTVPYYWTKDDPKKLPPMELLVVKGEETWDDTKKMNYLEFKVLPEILSTMKAALDSVMPKSDIGSSNNLPQTDIGGLSEEDIPEEADDLPF